MIALAVAVVLAAVLLAGVWMVDRWRIEACVRGRVRERMLVTLKSGETFSGVLLEADRSTVVLVKAEAEPDVPVDGELLLRWSEIAYVQRP